VRNVNLATLGQIVDYSHRRPVRSIRGHGYLVVALKSCKLRPQIRFDAWPQCAFSNSLPYSLSELAESHLFVVAQGKEFNAVRVKTS